MKRLIIPLLFFLVLSACKEKEVPAAKTKGPTIIKGRCTIVNTDIPAPNVDIYIYTGGFPTPQVLIDETVTDSNGNYALTYSGDHLYAKMGVNYPRTGFISGQQKFGEANTLVFEKDGKTHIQDFEMIPPAWVNIRIRDIEAKKGYDYLAVGSNFNSIKLANSWNSDTIVTMKVYGNMSDTIALGYYKSMSGNTDDIELQIIKFPITVPGFQFKDLLIEY
jgi:hypothetical protein